MKLTKYKHAFAGGGGILKEISESCVPQGFINPYLILDTLVKARKREIDTLFKAPANNVKCQQNDRGKISHTLDELIMNLKRGI